VPICRRAAIHLMGRVVSFLTRAAIACLPESFFSREIATLRSNPSLASCAAWSKASVAVSIAADARNLGLHPGAGADRSHAEILLQAVEAKANLAANVFGQGPQWRLGFAFDFPIPFDHKLASFSCSAPMDTASAFSANG